MEFHAGYSMNSKNDVLLLRGKERPLSGGCTCVPVSQECPSVSGFRRLFLLTDTSWPKPGSILLSYCVDMWPVLPHVQDFCSVLSSMKFYNFCRKLSSKV